VTSPSIHLDVSDPTPRGIRKTGLGRGRVRVCHQSTMTELQLTACLAMSSAVYVSPTKRPGCGLCARGSGRNRSEMRRYPSVTDCHDFVVYRASGYLRPFSIEEGRGHRSVAWQAAAARLPTHVWTVAGAKSQHVRDGEHPLCSRSRTVRRGDQSWNSHAERSRIAIRPTLTRMGEPLRRSPPSPPTGSSWGSRTRSSTQ
jgi:hypothetical protein